MHYFSEILSNWDTVSLQELESVALTRRIDTKFVLRVDQLLDLLELIKHDHKVLEIGDRRIFNYSTIYFDTPDFQFYKDHHNGYLHRMKVRKREYLDSGLKFYEIKKKLPGDQTDKTRLVIDAMDESLSEEQYLMVDYKKLNQRPLEKKLSNYFKRITLTHVNMQERITIDTDVNFYTDENKIHLPNIVILELKQPRYDVASPLVQTLKKMRIYPGSFSKYATGVVMLDLHQKQNQFKSQRMIIENLHSVYP